MDIKDYFEFDDCDRIRIKGTRISIEILLEPFRAGDSPEQILRNYRTSLTLEQVYATITYYLRNRQEIDAYLTRGRELEERLNQEYLRQEPSPVKQRLLALSEQKEPHVSST